MARVTQQSMQAAIAAMWERSRDTMLKRVDTIEQTARALLNNTFSDDARRDAEREAHKLAGARHHAARRRRTCC